MKCIACSGTEFKKTFLFKEWSSKHKRYYPLYRCKKCGLIRPFPLPVNEQTKNDFYNEKTGNAKFYNKNTQKIDFKDPEFKDYFKNFIQYSKAIKKYKIKGKSLDIGCGAGHLIILSKKNGMDSEGQDINSGIIESLRHEGFKVSNLDLKNLNKNYKYDLITFNHVLEHIENLDVFFSEIRKLLKKEGHIIFAFPYIYGLIPQVLRNKWYGLGTGDHLNFFSIDSLKRILSDNNFEIKEIKILSMDYSPFFLPKPLRIINSTICKLLVKLGLGDNLFIVAKKKN